MRYTYIFPPTNRHECQYTHLPNCFWCSESDCCDNVSPDSAKSDPKKCWTVRDMAAYYLYTRGYGGLVNSDGECGCTLDDFMPCQAEGIGCCEAAFIFDCYRCAKQQECEKAIIDDEVNDWVASSSEDYCHPDYRMDQSGASESASNIDDPVFKAATNPPKSLCQNHDSYQRG